MVLYLIGLPHRFCGFAAKGVCQFPWRPGLQQQLVLVLAVYVHQQLSELFQHRQGHRDAVDAALAFTGGGDPAFQEQKVLGFNVLFRQQGFHPGVGHVEDCLYPERVGAGAHERRRGPASQHYAEGIDEDGFAGPGFTGKDVEAAGEFHRRVFNQREVVHVQ